MSSDRSPRAGVIQDLIAALRTMSDHDLLLSQAMADRLGVHLTDLKALSFLRWQKEPVTAGKLADQTGLTSGAVTAVVDRLERAGFVRRARHPTDRRVVVLEPVADQLSALVALQSEIGQRMAASWSQFSATELELALIFVQRVSEVMRSEAERLRPTRPREAHIGDGRATVPLGNVQRGLLRFSSGAAVVKLHGGAPDDELISATFEGRMPTVKVDDGTVTVQYGRFSPFDWRKAGADLSLNEAIPWHIELRGGVSRLHADLSRIQLGGLDLTGGVSQVETRLPRPKGRVGIRITGGASSVTLRRPAKVAARVVLTGGASSLVLDEQQFASVGGLLRLSTPGAQDAKDFYDIEVSGGVSHVEVVTG